MYPYTVLVTKTGSAEYFCLVQKQDWYIAKIDRLGQEAIKTKTDVSSD